MKKGSALFAYALHAVGLNCSVVVQRWIIRNGHSLVGVPAGAHRHRWEKYLVLFKEGSWKDWSERKRCLSTLKHWIRPTSYVHARERKMWFLHKAMNMVLRPLKGVSERGLLMILEMGRKYQIFSQLVSYCFDILYHIIEVQNIFCQKLCIQCLNMFRYMRDMRFGEGKRTCHTKKERAREQVRQLTPTARHCVSEKRKEGERV